MVWNSVWPDGSKSVRENKTTGTDNTTYIETTQNIDHFWNIGANEDGHHQFAQMPKYVTGAPAVPSDPSLAAGMDLVYYSKQKTATEATVVQSIEAFARTSPSNAVMQLLGIRSCGVFNVAGGVVSIVYKHNVTSITRTATGLFTVTFTTAMPSVNYLFLGDAILNDANAAKSIQFGLPAGTALTAMKTTTTCKIKTFAVGDTSTNLDPLQCWFVAFGG